MEELCPMCKSHPAIIKKEKTITIIKGKEVEYEQIFYYCSALGRYDPDAYFIPAKAMDLNLTNARKAYKERYHESV